MKILFEYIENPALWILDCVNGNHFGMRGVVCMIENIISREEKIIWEGTPNKFLYIIGPVYIYLIAVIV